MNHRFNTLDGLRGVAAIAVIFFHFTQHTTLRLFSGAGLAVDLFFCLSGFVIAHSYQQRLIGGMSFKDFFLKRLVRLYPMFHMIGLMLGALALLMKSAYSQTSLTLHQTLSSIALNAFYVPYLSDFYIQIGKDKIDSALFPTNDPAWSLFFELLVNIVFAFVVIRTGRRKNPLPWVFTWRRYANCICTVNRLHRAWLVGHQYHRRPAENGLWFFCGRLYLLPVRSRAAAAAAAARYWNVSAALPQSTADISHAGVSFSSSCCRPVFPKSNVAIRSPDLRAHRNNTRHSFRSKTRHAAPGF